MAKILENKKFENGYFLLKVDQGGEATPGQFYMLHPKDGGLLLPRPLSIFDQDKETTTFLIAVVGKGTKTLEDLHVGDSIEMEGPYGNGFEKPNGKKTLCIGGGTGIAPFYHMSKFWKDEDFSIRIGLRERSEELEEIFERASDSIEFVYGGFVTEKMSVENIDQMYTCGPIPMMKSVFEKRENLPVYISLEERMGCGFGACLACSCETKSGRKKTCVDGPVYSGEEMLWESK